MFCVLTCKPESYTCQHIKVFNMHFYMTCMFSRETFLYVLNFHVRWVLTCSPLDLQLVSDHQLVLDNDKEKMWTTAHADLRNLLEDTRYQWFEVLVFPRSQLLLVRVETLDHQDIWLQVCYDYATAVDVQKESEVDPQCRRFSKLPLRAYVRLCDFAQA